MSPVPRTLLLSGTPPNSDGVGGIILSDLCEFLPPDSVWVAWAAEGDGVADPEIAHGMKVRSFAVPFLRRPVSRFGRPGRAVAAVAQTWRNRRSIKRAVEDCVSWARAEGIQQVWAVMDSPLTAETAAEIAERLGVPLRTTVWDDVHHVTAYCALDRFTARRSVAGFARALRASKSVAVIGETMQQEYRRVYGIDSVVVRHGLAPGDSPRATSDAQSVRIGFAGSVTAVSAFNSMLATLDRLGWKLGGRPVSLHLLGHRFDVRSPVARHVECHGWRSVEDSIRLLGKCDFNYLPQPFEASLKALAELSFPTKLTTYLAADRPLLLQSPPTGSLLPINSKYGFALACTSLDDAELEAAMESLLQSAVADRCVAGARSALATEFTHERFRAAFLEFMGLDAEALPKAPIEVSSNVAE